jgi:serine/threonine protein phosphatase PrpC
VAWLKGTKHKFYEDRYRLLPKTIPLVAKSNRGEVFAVFDGIGSAPEGMHSAQHMADTLEQFFLERSDCEPSTQDFSRLLFNANREIEGWGFMPGTDRPLGGAAGTIAWIHEGMLYLFHAGDTVGFLLRDGNVMMMTQLHDFNGAIYRYFGLGRNLEIDVTRMEIKNYDRILLMSDGVTKVFNPKEACRFIQGYDDIEEGVAELVRMSRLRGSSDDITALLYEYDAYPEE